MASSGNICVIDISALVTISDLLGQNLETPFVSSLLFRLLNSASILCLNGPSYALRKNFLVVIVNHRQRDVSEDGAWGSDTPLNPHVWAPLGHIPSSHGLR